MAGASCFETACDPEAFVLPLHWYAHDDGRCAITGGYVYRGSWRLLYGNYLFGDFCSGEIWTIDVDNGSETPIEQLDTDLMISSFGELRDGEILVVDYVGGAIYRLEPPSAAAPP